MSALYLSADDVAAELGVPRRTAYTYIGEMRHLKMGRNVRVSRAAFEAWKREKEECASSGNESDPTAPLEGRGKRTSLAAESRRDARRNDSRESGKTKDSSKVRIHVSQPRKERAST